MSRGAIVIHMTAPDKTLRERLAARGDDMITGDIVGRLRDAYVSFARLDTQLPTLTRHAGLSDLNIDSLIYYAQVHEIRASRLNAFTTYVGAPSVRYLVLGDQRSHMIGDGVPAFMPYLGRSGSFLLQNFRGFAEDKYYGFANACDVDDPWRLWRTLGKPKIVALGDWASDALDSIPNMPHGAVPHPRHVRRFYQRDGEQYGQLLNS